MHYALLGVQTWGEGDMRQGYAAFILEGGGKVPLFYSVFWLVYQAADSSMHYAVHPGHMCHTQRIHGVMT